MEQKKLSVMFVCLGNIIRSPTCEGLLRTLVTNDVFVDSSAVTRDDLGQHPHRYAQQVCQRHGFNISSHVSKLITNDDFNNFDLIVSLEGYVLSRLKAKKPKNSKSKIVSFSKYDISNPWCGDLQDFIDMYGEIEEAMQSFVKNYIPPEYIKQK